MRRLLIFLLALFATTRVNAQDVEPSSTPQNFVADSTQSEDPSGVLEVLLVTGEQPGPKLWKVSRDDHVMWVLGTHGPLPKNMSWRSKEVEDAIANSQEILTAGGFEPALDIAWYKIPFLAPSMFRAARSPGRATLQEIVPADVYVDWLELKAKYLGKDDGVEKWRPAFAWEKLYGEAFERSGLSYEDEIWPEISKLARKHKIKITDTSHRQKIAISKARAALKEFSTTDINDVNCFTESVRNLERNLTTMKQLANSWAIGDVHAYEATSRPNLAGGCQNVIFEAALASQSMQSADVEEYLKRGVRSAHDKWLTAVQNALTNNPSTFALLPMHELTSSEGRIAALVSQGYVVEGR